MAKKKFQKSKQLTFYDLILEQAFLMFPVEARGDDRDRNFIKRECFKAGAAWALKLRASK